MDKLSEPPCADPHAGWCGGWRRPPATRLVDSLTALNMSLVVAFAFVFIPHTSKGDFPFSFLDIREKVAPSLRRISTSSFCAIFNNLDRF